MQLGRDLGPMLIEQCRIAGVEVVFGERGQWNETYRPHLRRAWEDSAGCESLTKSGDSKFWQTLIIEIQAVRTGFFRNIGDSIHAQQSQDLNLNSQFFKYLAPKRGFQH